MSASSATPAQQDSSSRQGAEDVKVLPACFVGATGYRERIVIRALPFAPPTLEVDMVWHLRNDRSSEHPWWRCRLQEAAATHGV
jgi:hypothetical protein